MPSSAKFLKEVLSIKRKWEGGEMVELNVECSAILQNKLPPKLKDPGSFSIPCTIGNIDFDKVLCDLGASVNLMPYSIFEKLGMHELTPSIITLQLADRSIKYPRGIVEDVLVKVGKFIIPVDFIVLDMEEDKNMPLILGRPFLATSRALIDVQKGQLTLRVNDEHVVFNVFKPMKYLHKKEHAIFAIDNINTFGTDNVHLVKCKDSKGDYIKNSNGNNLQDMKEEHEEVLNFVDTRQEVKSKLQKKLLLNGSTSNPKVKPPFEVSSDRKKASEGKWGRPNRMKRWRNQVDENVGFYKEHTKAWNESHMKKKKFKDAAPPHSEHRRRYRPAQPLSSAVATIKLHTSSSRLLHCRPLFLTQPRLEEAGRRSAPLRPRTTVCPLSRCRRDSQPLPPLSLSTTAAAHTRRRRAASSHSRRDAADNHHHPLPFHPSPIFFFLSFLFPRCFLSGSPLCRFLMEQPGPSRSRRCLSKNMITLPPTDTDLSGHLHFRSQRHRDRYSTISQCVILSGKSLHHPTMIELLICDRIDALTINSCWQCFCDVKHPVFVKLVREFYSTFEFEPPAHLSTPNAIKFRLCGRTFQLSVTDFNLALGFIDSTLAQSEDYLTSACDFSDNFVPQRFYLDITTNVPRNNRVYDSSKTKDSYIEDPALKYLHRFLAYTFLGRKDSSAALNKMKLFFLWSMLTHTRINLGFWVASQFQIIISKHDP
ncbi:UNVERIFIED_CONTAM: hypothetical protein Slati_2397300 [Sesamum latifolium]|uniref:Arabidopsis retrotransposon Orf1 C-terminal domain-containing protein n=1 Tax=Sesamum latifolium TaxID=2727402 RepID=A0AAW2WCH3_9LAMI